MKHRKVIILLIIIVNCLLPFIQPIYTYSQTTFKMPTRPYGAVVVDYDLDGDNDIVVGTDDLGSQDIDSIVLMINDGWGNFELKGFEANSGIFIFCEDLTGDGYPDIISRDADSIFYHENNKKNGIGNMFSICDTHGNRMVNGITDMDTNGLNDIIYNHSQYDHGWGIIYNLGQNHFVDGYFYPSNTDGWLRPYLGDLNEDDIEDVLVTSNVKESGVFTLINKISSFQKKGVIEEAWTEGLILDVNNNDTNDILVFRNFNTTFVESAALLFQNQVSSYEFIDTARFIGGGELGSTGDFNLDGYPDLALFINSWDSDPSEDSVFIYTSNQNFGFNLTHKHYIGAWFNPQLISGDLNMDGFPDLLSLGYYNPTIDHIQILWNDQNGWFIDTNNVFVGTPKTRIKDNVCVYPNPTYGILHIESPIKEIQKIVISDFRGKVLFQGHFNDKKLSLNLHCLSSKNNYFLCSIELTNGEIYHKKILIIN